MKTIVSLEQLCNTNKDIADLSIVLPIDSLYEIGVLPEVLFRKIITDVSIYFNQDNKWAVAIWSSDWDYTGDGNSIIEAATEAISGWNRGMRANNE